MYCPLKEYYDYWDKFIMNWIEFKQNFPNGTSWTSYKNLYPWKFPNFSNTDATNPNCDPTIQYIPEPWGGNDGTYPLQSVVINYNPGTRIQAQTNILPQTFTDYYHLVRGADEDNYNYKNRAKHIFDSLSLLNVNLQCYNKLENHLTVELLPWHSKKWTLASKYAKQNRNAIFNYSIKFAAETSKQIINDKLRNVVLVRASITQLLEIFEYNKQNPYNIKIIVPESDYINGEKLDCSKYAVIKFIYHDMWDVKFLVIWRPKRGFSSQNNFPNCLDFIKILKFII